MHMKVLDTESSSCRAMHGLLSCNESVSGFKGKKRSNSANENNSAIFGGWDVACMASNFNKFQLMLNRQRHDRI